MAVRVRTTKTEMRFKFQWFLQYIDTLVTFKDYGTKQYLKIAVFWSVPPYNVYKFINVLEECGAP
jgi:hypothetical protein